MTDITAVNARQGLVLLDTGETAPITNLLDSDGADTEDAGAAVVAIAPLPDGQWACIDLTQFEPASVH